MKYPKYNKQKLDKLSQMKFRKYQLLVSNSIYITNDNLSVSLSKKDIDILSWNCAYEILTNN